MDNIAVVILAGGSGTRLWPLSRREMPKHLIPLLPNGENLLEATYERAKNISDAVYIVTERKQKKLILENCQSITQDRIIEEPKARGTAAALTLATLTLGNIYGHDLSIASLHADHYISDQDAYVDAILRALDIAGSQNAMATVGIKPKYPATGFGYIECHAVPIAQGVYKVKSFKEKPSLEMAKAYISSGQYFWNLGLFAWTYKSFVKEISIHGPDHYLLVQKYLALHYSGAFDQAENEYQRLMPEAIDTLVMEKTDNLYMIVAGFDWKDVGSWLDLGEIFDIRDGNNRVYGNCVGLDASDCILYNDRGIMGVIGIKDLIVVKVGDSVLVCPKDRAQDVKKLTEIIGRLFPEK